MRAMPSLQRSSPLSLFRKLVFLGVPEIGIYIHVDWLVTLSEIQRPQLNIASVHYSAHGKAVPSEIDSEIPNPILLLALLCVGDQGHEEIHPLVQGLCGALLHALF